MSELTTFPLFSLFPNEIRLEIWARALQTRIITFECELYNFSPRHAPQSLYLVGGDPPYTHFEIGIPERPASPYYLVQAYPARLGASPPLLSTCHESRDVALRCGYRRWTIQNQVLGTRHVMWNPKYDAISLQTSRLINDSCLDAFVQQFPEQVREIQRLVVDTAHWLRGDELNSASTILRFPKLVELAVIADSDCVNQEWQLAGEVNGIKGYFAEAKKRLMRKATPGSEEYRALDSWHLPRIRAVGSVDELLSRS